AGGVELALAMRSVLPAGVQLYVVGRHLLPGHNLRVRCKVERVLQERQIIWCEESVMPDAEGGIRLADGLTFTAARTLWATDVQAPDWLAASPLAVDEAGFVKVNQHLQSISHANIFAAGDAAHLVGQERAKSGVYAVRAGPYLADNLRRSLTAQPLRIFRAQKQHLALIGTGDGRAIASRGEMALSGRWLWRWKDYIDRTFMNKFNKLPKMSEATYDISNALRDDLPEAVMRCGGCGAKLAADPLKRVLQRLPSQASAQVTLGIGDDAAEVLNRGPSTLLTVDGFRAMLDDPYLFGRIAAHHSLNDIFAMGAQGTAALALVTVPLMAEAMMEEDLFQMLSGATAVLNAHNVPLVGGHSAEGAELSIGLTITGAPHQQGAALSKTGAQPGDVLVLTKPLGTGVVLAGAMQGLAAPDSMAQVIAGMDFSNQPAMQVLLQHQARALTDVTGFGLAGHLGEMLRGAGVGVDLDLAAVPMYPGAIDLLANSPSSLQQANELALQDYVLAGGLRPDNARLRLLADPQTSGGLLAAVPAAQLAACLQALQSVCVAATAIGEITAADWQIR
ncbi:MAG: selenide, water dikinase SelD, partial [Pseudomonadota bacterium]